MEKLLLFYPHFFHDWARFCFQMRKKFFYFSKSMTYWVTNKLCLHLEVVEFTFVSCCVQNRERIETKREQICFLNFSKWNLRVYDPNQFLFSSDSIWKSSRIRRKKLTNYISVLKLVIKNQQKKSKHKKCC